jgi:hypothetical protein
LLTPAGSLFLGFWPYDENNIQRKTIPFTSSIQELPLPLPAPEIARDGHDDKSTRRAIQDDGRSETGQEKRPGVFWGHEEKNTRGWALECTPVVIE